MKSGILACLLSAVSFGVTPMFSKLLTVGGLSASSIVVYLFLFNAIFSTAICRARGISVKPTAAQRRGLFLSGVVGVGMTAFCLSSSYQYIPLGNSTVVHYLYPTLVTVYMVLTRRESWNWRKVLAIGMSLAGLMLTAGFSLEGKAAGYALSLLSAIFFGAYITANQSTAYVSLPTCTKMRSLFWAACGACMVIAILKGDLMPLSGGEMLLYVLGMSMCSCIAHFFLAYGVVMVGAVTAAFISMVEPVTSILIGVFIFKETASLTTVLGMALILGAVLMIGLESARQRTRQ